MLYVDLPTAEDVTRLSGAREEGLHLSFPIVIFSYEFS